MYHQYHFIILFVTIGYGYAAIYNQPKLSVSDGNLVIQSANNRNISLETQGTGYVNINGQNLVRITQMAFNASRTVQRIRGGVIQSMESSLNRLSEIIDGPHGLGRRVHFLEQNGNISGAIAPNSASYQPVPLNRKLNALRRRLTRLEASVSYITRTLNRDECSSNPCKNGGRCQDLFGDFMCICPDNWEGPLCDSDVNECANFAGTDLGCQNGATCLNKPGTYECLCTPGWYGIHCIRKTADCSSGSSEDLCGHGTCVSNQNTKGYSCICDQGWTKNGKDSACTVDVDECSSRIPPCSISPLVTCINLPGSFVCGSCPAGYTGNGHYCVDVDECIGPNNGGCSVLPKVNCINTPGSRVCGSCPSGYVGDGVTCTFVGGACQVANGGCHPLAKCMDNVHISSTYVQCICPAGYRGQGIGPNGCIRDQSLPIIVNEACASNPCLHGTCVPNQTGFNCICTGGFTGTLCNIPNSCWSNPCLNGGTCTPTSAGDFSCTCTKSFRGKRCQFEGQSCGGYLHMQTGALRYPMSNSTTYDHRVSCGWTIETNSSLVINVTFSQFHIEETTDCLYDWLQIHDGRNTASRLIGRFCGSKLPLGGTISSTHNMIYLWFRSDGSVSESGFALTWKSVEPSCSGIIETETHGTLQSPGSPGNYPPNRDCAWLIFAPPDKRLLFHFFTLVIGNNPNCSFDYLKITDFPDNELVALYCNTSHPEPLVTPGSKAVVNFHSDGSGSYAGFQLTFSVIEGVPGCGGMFNRRSGEIRPPIENGKYLSDLSCEYKIRMPLKSRIKLTFVEMAIEKSSTCKHDYVSIREGFRPDSPLVGQYCGDVVPPIYYSIGNEILITFKSDWSITDAGFLIKYEMLCGETFIDANGFIQSPGYPNEYAQEMHCVYIIQRPPGHAITLTFVAIELEMTEECDYDYVEVKDGDSDNSRSMGRFCGELPDPLTSTHNIMRIEFVTDESVSSAGFLANYTSEDLGCGGIYKENVGAIQSPTDLTDLMPTRECKWMLIAPIGFVVQLGWMSFHLQKSFNCSSDSIEIYDGSEISVENRIGRYCGYTLPPTSVSSSNIITIIFLTNPTGLSEGFMASYRFVNETLICGGNYMTPTGTIRSPGYPSNYPKNRDCVWTIRAPVGQQIFLDVIDFNIESHKNCIFDYLEIRNGGHYTSPLVGKFCGNTIPRTMVSFTNEIYLRFRSDWSRSAHGFLIHWDGTINGCGGRLTSYTGHIMSPNYPQPYSNNLDCSWKITVSAGSIIQATFSDIDLEAGAGCRFDYIAIHDGTAVTKSPIGVYCVESHMSSIIRTKSNNMLIVFKSDKSQEGRGFNLKYSAVCNCNIKERFNGVIESPNFPDPYPDDADCTWIISVPEGNKIHVVFSHMTLEMNDEDNSTCTYDTLTIKEGEDNQTATTTLGTFCGEALPDPFTSTTNNVFIHFKSDEMSTSNGFRLEWTIEGCGGHLTRPTGVLSTPGYPSHYPTSTVCEWLIEVDYSHSVELSIEHIELEATSGCEFDSLTIFGGPDETSPVLAHLCNVAKDNYVLTSSGHNMFIRFTSDPSFSAKGFKATYKSVPIRCGGKMSTLKGSITTRNYPKNYDNNDDCAWLIEVPEVYLIEFTFTDFDIEYYRNCSGDYVQVHDGGDSDAPILVTHCGNTLPTPSSFKSSTNKLFIRMKSDGYFSAKGFKADYKIACGKRIVTDSNGILNVNMKDNEDSNCTWIIESAVPGKHVSLSFTYLHLPFCYAEYMEESFVLCVYEGLDAERKFGCYCQENSPPTITSEGSTLMILSSTNDGEFTVTYSIFDSACGGELLSLKGSFASIGYPKNYPPDADCVWTIHASEGNEISITFEVFELEPTDDNKCNNDFVEVRQTNSTGPILGLFCGNSLPVQLKSVGKMWIQFKTDSEGTAKGFLAKYTFGRGAELNGTSGRIQSPLYPKPYPLSEDLEWLITAPVDQSIRIKFNDFYMNAWSSPSTCYFYKMEIYDGNNEDAPVLLTECGTTKPEPATSTSNIVFIKFSTASYTGGSYFDLEWIAVPKNPVKWQPKLEVDGCGSKEVIPVNVTSTVIITSPGYPTGYRRNLDCVWLFSTNETEHLALLFSHVDIVTNAECTLDYISVYTGIDGTNDFKKVQSVCYRNVSHILPIRTSNLMKVLFHSNAYRNNSGFSAKVIAECGGSIKSSFGVLEMTKELQNSFRRFDMSQVFCQWNITVKNGRKISIDFQRFEILSSDLHICENYILFKNGKYDGSPFLGNGKYCGSEIPSIPMTTGNTISIEYSANRFSKGFKLVYQEVSKSCGQSITLSDDEPLVRISSPNYPNIPDPHIECIWIITAPQGEAIQVDFFDRFDLTRGGDCKFEGVELRDGATRNSRLIDTFCKDLPSSQKTRGNFLFFRFYTEVPSPKNGFRANISIAKCGGTIRSSSGRINSPTNLNNGDISPNVNCEWRIVAPPDHIITLNFTQIQLPASSNCSTVAHIAITETNIANDSEIVLRTLCNAQKNQIVELLTNDVTVTLTSVGKKWPTNTGFKMEFNSIMSECGGRLVGTEGVFTSPNYPVCSNRGAQCKWVIEVPKGRIIDIEFLDLDFPAETNLYEQALEFFNSEKLRNTLMLEITTSNQIPVRSSWHIMTVIYWIERNAPRCRGFKAKYTSNKPAVCEGTLNDNKGVIGITEKLANLTTFYCEWQRDVQPEDINLNQTMAFVIELKNASDIFSKSCTYSRTSIQIYDASKDILLADVCRTTSKPITLRTPFINNVIQVIRKQWKMNFTINYSVHPCGGVLSGSNINITSPRYPDMYAANMECAWLVTLGEGQTIKIEFETLDLNPSCETDFVAIYNGPVPNSPLLMKLCGNTKPDAIISEQNKVWIDFHSGVGDSTKRKGFKIVTTPIDSGCGGIFHDVAKVISSPNFPKSYPNNAECTWEVRAPNGFFVELEFIDRFQLEDSTDCINDFVEVWDYVDDKWLSLGRSCGRYPVKYNSSSTQMRIMFRSNSQINGIGFKAKWSLNCGGIFTPTNIEKTIYSPGYPFYYPTNLFCNYTFIPVGKYMNIIFSDLHLEKNGYDCPYDNVTIKTKYRLFGVFCHNDTPPAIRTKETVFVIFKSDKWISRAGFAFKYHTDVCGGVITAPTEISSPTVYVKDRDRYEYFHSLGCTWNITAPKGRIIVLRFASFDIEHNMKCTFDSISIYDGLTVNASSRLALLCGKGSNAVIKSTTNEMIVHLKTDMTNNFGGFKANVIFTYGESVGCGGSYVLSEKNRSVQIDSPHINGSNTYEPFMDCHWLVNVPFGYNVILTFTSFHVSPCNVDNNLTDCECDRVEARDGAGPLSELILKHCGHTLPKEVTTSGHNLFLRFATDTRSNAPSTGFTATVRISPSLCGNSILNVTNQSQTLTSPNYPLNYPPNIKCSWLLTNVNRYVKFDIHFETLELEGPDSNGLCTNDRLVIFDKSDSLIISEGLGTNFVFSGARYSNSKTPAFIASRMPTTQHEFCGTGKPIDYYTNSRQTTIQFITNDHNQHKGFKITYSLMGCNRNFTGVQGRIWHDQVQSDCHVTITAPKDYTISLYFQSFLMFTSENCNDAALVVTNGTTNGTTLAKLCGFLTPNPVFSTGNFLSLRTFMNRKVIRTSYDITYTTTDKGRGCGGQLYNYGGVFTSPMYPGSYRNANTCRWEVSTPKGTVVVLKFQTFDLGPKNTCDTDYVELFDVDTVTGEETLRTRYCGGQIPATYVSESNIMAVVYHTSPNNGGTGWVANFMSKKPNQEIINW